MVSTVQCLSCFYVLLIPSRSRARAVTHMLGLIYARTHTHTHTHTYTQIHTHNYTQIQTCLLRVSCMLCRHCSFVPSAFFVNYMMCARVLHLSCVLCRHCSFVPSAFFVNNMLRARVLHISCVLCRHCSSVPCTPTCVCCQPCVLPELPRYYPQLAIVVGRI